MLEKSKVREKMNRRRKELSAQKVLRKMMEEYEEVLFGVR